MNKKSCLFSFCLLVALAAVPCTAKHWLFGGDDDRAASGSSAPAGQTRQVVSPTFLDTLNRGKEIVLAESEVAPITPGSVEPKNTAPTLTTKKTASGFRVQCFASGSIDAVRQKKKEIESKFDYGAYIVFVEPYYKLQVGDFASRAEAESALARIRTGGYSEAWIVSASVLTGN